MRFFSNTFSCSRPYSVLKLNSINPSSNNCNYKTEIELTKLGNFPNSFSDYTYKIMLMSQKLV